MSNFYTHSREGQLLSLPGQVGYSTAICTVKENACYTKADKLTIVDRQCTVPLIL